MGKNDAVRQLLGIDDTLDTWLENWRARLRAVEGKKVAQQLYLTPAREQAPIPTVQEVNETLAALWSPPELEQIRKALYGGRIWVENEYVED